jgi:hypothetical protein
LYYQLRYKSHYEDLEKRNQDITKAENIMKQMLGDLGRLVQEKGYLFFSGETHDKKVNKIILRKNEKNFSVVEFDFHINAKKQLEIILESLCQ